MISRDGFGLQSAIQIQFSNRRRPTGRDVRRRCVGITPIPRQHTQKSGSLGILPRPSGCDSDHRGRGSLEGLGLISMGVERE